MTIRFLLLGMLALSTVAHAQKFSVKGQLLDTLSAPLPSATVLLLRAADSSLVNFAVSDAQGNFEIRNISGGEYFFKATYVGFRNFTQKVVTASASVIDLGNIKLEATSNELEAVEISAERTPVTVKHDTIEFNAGSFKTKQNATVEDLLKKLPGVEVDNDGNVTAQGEQVRRVTVDGKNFFGSDPKVATKNLPADAIDKVQVFDRKSDQAAFSGIEDGQREKTINLELKEEKRHGAFGTLIAGAGTDDRFEARASLNRFSKGRQLSFLGMGNNVNEQGFSMEEYMNFTGGSQQMMSGRGAVRMEFNGDNQNGVPMNFGNRANGIMTNYAGGVNMNNEFSSKTELNGSFFYNYLDHARDQTSLRENYLPGGSFTFDERSKQNNTNNNHRVNVTLDHKLDSANSLKLTGNVSYNETDSETRSTSLNTLPNGEVQNESERLSLAQGTSTTINSSLLWRHKFNKKNRTFSANFQVGFSDSDRQGFLQALNTFYSPDPSTQEIMQTSEQATVYKGYSGTFSYTEPLGKRKYLEGNYTYRRNLNDVVRDVYDMNSGEPDFNEQLSNRYDSRYEYHRAGINFRVVRSKYNLVVGSSVQSTNLTGDLELAGVNINRSYQNVLPTLRFNYDFSNTRHLRFDYETSVQEPAIQQLQPVVDNSDPLNVYVGNPALRPAWSQSWRAQFNTFDPVTFINFFGFADIDHTTNAIATAQTISEQLVRTTRPVNVSSNLNITVNTNFGFPIQKMKSRFGIGANYRSQQSVTVLNDQENDIVQQTIGGSIRYSYRYKEIFDLSLSADLRHQLTGYDFEQPDQTFVNKTYTAESTLSFLKNYQLSTELEYLVYTSKSTGFNQSIPLLGVSLSRFVLKNKSGEIKVSVNNAFDRALGVNQTANVNYLERQTINSLGRYFMVSFTYSLNKQLNPMGTMRRGGGMMRVIRQ